MLFFNLSKMHCSNQHYLNRAIKDAVGDSVSDAPGVGNAIGLVAGIAAGIAFTYATKIYVNDNGKNITDEVKNYLYDIAGVN